MPIDRERVAAVPLDLRVLLSDSSACRSHLCINTSWAEGLGPFQDESAGQLTFLPAHTEAM